MSKLPTDPFEHQYVNFHLSEAEGGNYESARWLKNWVRADPAFSARIDPYVHWVVTEGFVRKMASGGLRSNSRQPGQVGKRGKSGRTEHHQLLLAREMWKFLKLTEGTVEAAALYVSGKVRSSVLSYSSARAAYYRFTRREPVILLAELSRDFSECPQTWHQLCKEDEAKLQLALNAAAQLRDCTSVAHKD